MQTIKVRTTQNVFIHYPLASIGDRIVAYIVDGFILYFYLFAVGAAMLRMQVEIWWLYIIFLGLPYIFYSLCFEILMNGQTPGKRVMKIKVIRLDGTEPSVGSYLFRWLFRIIDFALLTPGVAIIAIAGGGKGQRIGDMVAGTAVVKIVEEKEIKADEIFITTADTYQATFPSVTQLSSKEIEIIQQALIVGRDGNLTPAQAVSTRIKSMLGIESDMSELAFLETLIKDFNHINSQA